MKEVNYIVRADGLDKWLIAKFDGGSLANHYIVNKSRNKVWYCNCPHGVHRKGWAKTHCKHVGFVKTHIQTGKNQF